jgi:sensitive to high expression protein 9
MKPLLGHASRSIISNATIVIPPRFPRPSLSLARSASSTPSICLKCQFRASIATIRSPKNQFSSRILNEFRRRYHQTPNDGRKLQDQTEPPVDTSLMQERTSDVIDPSSTHVNRTEKKSTNVNPTIETAVKSIPRVPAEDLPSHREAQRWDFSKRLTEMMDELLPKLAVVTQKVNTLTGTDYSGIEALKQEIKEHGMFGADAMHIL